MPQTEHPIFWECRGKDILFLLLLLLSFLCTNVTVTIPLKKIRHTRDLLPLLTRAAIGADTPQEEILAKSCF